MKTGKIKFLDGKSFDASITRTGEIVIDESIGREYDITARKCLETLFFVPNEKDDEESSGYEVCSECHRNLMEVDDNNKKTCEGCGFFYHDEDENELNHYEKNPIED